MLITWPSWSDYWHFDLWRQTSNLSSDEPLQGGEYCQLLSQLNWLRYVKTLRIQICPKNGISSQKNLLYLLWGWDWDHQSSSIGGVWILRETYYRGLEYLAVSKMCFFSPSIWIIWLTTGLKCPTKIQSATRVAGAWTATWRSRHWITRVCKIPSISFIPSISLLQYTVRPTQWRCILSMMRGFPKMVLPNQPMGVPTKKGHFGVEIGGTRYHHLRKHRCTVSFRHFVQLLRIYWRSFCQG